MSPRTRKALLLVGLGVFVAALVAGFTGLPDFGHYQGPYGDVLNRHAVDQRHVTNVVSSVVFDYRGFDTMGEEFILFCSVVGVIALLRGNREKDPVVDERTNSSALRMGGLLALGPALVLAAWLATYGYITPGGGFQAGVLLAGAVLLVYLAWSHRAFARVAHEDRVDPVEGAAASGYVLVGLAAILAGLPFLHNLLGLGETGTLVASGNIGVLNWISALEVAAANLLLFSEFLAAYIAPVLKRRGEA